MIVVTRIFSLAFLCVANGVEKEQILNGIKPISDALGYINEYSTSTNLRRVFHNLTDFADSITMLNGQFNDSDPIDRSIKTELTKMKYSFLRIESEFFNTDLSAMNDIVKQKFESSIKVHVNYLLKFFISFIEVPDKSHKNALTQACNTTNSMKDVLTNLHIEIVNRDGNNDTFNQLFDGGVSLKQSFFTTQREVYNFTLTPPPPQPQINRASAFRA